MSTASDITALVQGGGTPGGARAAGQVRPDRATRGLLVPPPSSPGLQSSGLVGQVTTVRLGHSSVKQAFKDMNRQRRIRRMRRVVIGAADATREVMGPRTRIYAVLVTLTYAGDGQWSSEHISRYIKRTRDFLSRQGSPAVYQWVMELTQRGRPHYHIVWWLPVGVRIPKPDSAGHWVHGWSNIKRATRPVGYLVKYATKGGIDCGELPKGARLFGTGHGGEDYIRHAAQRYGLPTWLFRSSEDYQIFRRVPRVGWVCRETGEVRSSPFRVEVNKDPWGIVYITIEELKCNS